MKRFLSVLIMCASASALAWATPPRDPYTSPKGPHQNVHRHHAHKAGKHRPPKRHRHGL